MMRQGTSKPWCRRNRKPRLKSKKCVVADVEHVFFPTKPIVPNIDIVHNRAVLELFRGCSRGAVSARPACSTVPSGKKTPEQLVKTWPKDIVANSGYE